MKPTDSSPIIISVFVSLKLKLAFNSSLKGYIFFGILFNWNLVKYHLPFTFGNKFSNKYLFKALSINNSKEYCSKEQFNTFINNHKSLNINIFSETNEEMIESYIMVDPYGRFYQNSGAIYQYSKSILELESNEIINHVNFDLKKYKNRY